MNQNVIKQKRKFETCLISTMMLLLCAANIVNGQQRKTYEIQSPDKTIELVVTVENEITYSVTVDGNIVVEPSQISMPTVSKRV